MKKVMVVDDEIMVRMGMKVIINWEEHGYQVVAEASSGKDALAKLKYEQPDLIFTDLIMEDGDGFLLITECKRLYPSIKFVILSNHNDFEYTRNAMRLGAIDYIFKLTVSAEELGKVLSHADAFLETAEPPLNERFLNKNKSAIKNRLIMVAAEQSYIDEQSFLEECRALRLRIDFEKTFVVLQLSIDNFRQLFYRGKLEKLQLTKYGMENMLYEILGSDTVTEVFHFRDDLLIIINPHGDCSYQKTVEWLRESFLQTKEYFKRYFYVDITGALSLAYTGLDQVGKAVEQTDRWLSYRTESENGQLHTFEQPLREEIVKIRDYLLNHLQDELSIEVASNVVNMSHSYFSHLFKEEMNISFTDYVNRIRILKACELLSNTKLKIQQIACMVGYNNFNYFCVIFKKQIGMTPNQYRSNNII